MRDLHSQLVACCIVVVLASTSSQVLGQEEILRSFSASAPLNERTSAEQSLLDMGSKAIPILREGMKHPDESIRIGSIQLLGELRCKEALPDLVQHLTISEQNRDIFAACYAIGQTRDKRAATTLLQMASLSTRESARRRAAIIALGILDDKTAVPVLEVLLTQEPDEMLRVFIAGSLALLGSDKGFDAAFRSIHSTDPSIRMHSVQALGFMGKKETVPVLEQLLRASPSVVIRQTTQLAIFQITLHGLTVENRVSVIKAKLLSEKRLSVMARWGVQELMSIGGAGAEVALNELIRSAESIQIREQATRSLKVMRVIAEQTGGPDNEK